MGYQLPEIEGPALVYVTSDGKDVLILDQYDWDQDPKGIRDTREDAILTALLTYSTEQFEDTR